MGERNAFFQNHLRANHPKLETGSGLLFAISDRGWWLLWDRRLTSGPGLQFCNSDDLDWFARGWFWHSERELDERGGGFSFRKQSD